MIDALEIYYKIKQNLYLRGIFFNIDICKLELCGISVSIFSFFLWTHIFSFYVKSTRSSEFFENDLSMILHDGITRWDQGGTVELTHLIIAFYPILWFSSRAVGKIMTRHHKSISHFTDNLSLLLIGLQIFSSIIMFIFIPDLSTRDPLNIGLLAYSFSCFIYVVLTLPIMAFEILRR